MRIDFNHIEDKDIIFQLLHKPITQQIVDYEYKIFNEEFGSINYINRVLEKCNKLFLSDDRSNKPKQFSLQEINLYHKTYIIEGKYVLINDNTNEIVDHNFNESKLQTLEQYMPPILEYHIVYLE